MKVSQLQDTSLCPSSCGKPSTRVGRDRTVTGPVPNPSSCTYPLHHSSVKTLSYSQACKILWPKSPTQQIRCPVKFLSLQPSPANKKCLCDHTSPRSCASSTCTHLLFFLLSSSPSLTAIKGKRWQQDNCWEFLLFYVHKTPL